MLRRGNEEADSAAKDAINSSITSKIQNFDIKHFFGNKKKMAIKQAKLKTKIFSRKYPYMDPVTHKNEIPGDYLKIENRAHEDSS